VRHRVLWLSTPLWLNTSATPDFSLLKLQMTVDSFAT
jgi:hypothetical protein